MESGRTLILNVCLYSSEINPYSLISLPICTDIQASFHLTDMIMKKPALHFDQGSSAIFQRAHLILDFC